MNNEITSSERELLLMLLQKEENTLNLEINHTNHRDFRLLLKDRLYVIDSLISKLKVTENKSAFYAIDFM